MNNFPTVHTPTIPSPVGSVPHLVSQQTTASPLHGEPVYPNSAPTMLEVPAVAHAAERFALLGEVSPEEMKDGHTRVFTGNGTPFLDVPGLIRLESLRIGNTPLPLFELRKYPLDATDTRFQDVNEPLFALDRHSDNTPVIIRAKISNDGRWQDGAKIYVTGEWEEVPEDENPQSAIAQSESDFDAAVARIQAQANKAVEDAQRAYAAAIDAVTRQQVLEDTGDTRIADIEGQAPTIVDPVATVQRIHTPAREDSTVESDSDTAEDSAKSEGSKRRNRS